jgi:hypothetical protein
MSKTQAFALDIEWGCPACSERVSSEIEGVLAVVLVCPECAKGTVEVRFGTTKAPLEDPR